MSIIPGPNPLSLSFFVKSALVSLVFLISIAATESYVSNTNFQDLFLSKGNKALVFLSVLIVTNIFIDYLANSCTVALLFLAGLGRSWVATLAVSIANIGLTMNIFAWIFPVGLLVCFVINVGMTTDLTFQLMKYEDRIVFRPRISRDDLKFKYDLAHIIVQAASKDRLEENDLGRLVV